MKTGIAACASDWSDSSCLVVLLTRKYLSILVELQECELLEGFKYSYKHQSKHNVEEALNNVPFQS